MIMDCPNVDYINTGCFNSTLLEYGRKNVYIEAPDYNTSEVIANWGKNALSGFNLTNTTQIKQINFGYELLINDKVVEVIINNNQNTDKLQKPDIQPIAISNRLDLIKDSLGLSITQLAELFGVTRKTVYDWYDGTEPRSTTSKRMEILIEALNDTSSKIDITRLKTVWHIPISGKSFCALVVDDNIDNKTLQKALAEKMHELSTRMVATASTIQKSNNNIGDAHLGEYDRRANFN